MFISAAARARIDNEDFYVILVLNLAGKFSQLSNGGIRFSENIHFHRENRHQMCQAKYFEKFGPPEALVVVVVVYARARNCVIFMRVRTICTCACYVERCSAERATRVRACVPLVYIGAFFTYIQRNPKKQLQPAQLRGSRRYTYMIETIFGLLQFASNIYSLYTKYFFKKLRASVHRVHLNVFK
ncbi:unnamed protein product, partial [Trichogramma brassicae]